MPKFEVVSEYQPAGDQPEAIAALSRGLEMGLDEQTLLGVTGSGKTFTMAKIIEQVQRPTLVLAHNKTLAAQLCAEFREFFPNNAVEYFVSYYDYYQPEAYIPHTDTFIEKDSAINEEIDRLRLSATASLLERRDMYGYEMIEALRLRSNHVFDLKAGTLYPLLHALEEQRWVVSYDETADGGRVRRYYHLTADGRNALREKEAEWAAYAEAVGRVLGGEPCGT